MTAYTDWLESPECKKVFQSWDNYLEWTFNEGRRVGIEAAAEIAKYYQADHDIYNDRSHGIYECAVSMERDIRKLLEDK